MNTKDNYIKTNWNYWRGNWKNKTITQLRKGGIDVSEINTLLKDQHPEWTGKERQEYISYEVFGSD